MAAYSLAAILACSQAAPCKAAGTRACASPLSASDFPSVREQDLLRRMLTFDPKMRVSAAAALRHPFF
eukprot:4064750-Pleurochrysis_carterae.AAC.1